MIEYSNLKSYNQIWTPMGRYPMIDNTIFETYQEALTFATNNAVAVVGSVITVTNDTDSNRNGVYLLIYTGETPLSALSQPTGLEKLGSDIDLSNYVTTEALNSKINDLNLELDDIDELVSQHLNTLEDLYETLMSGNTNILDFKGFVENIEITQEGTQESGNDIYFNLTNKLFVIKINLNYYSSWEGSQQYQKYDFMSGTTTINDDILFRYDNIYKWDGENLIDIFGNSKYLNEFIDAEDNNDININLDNNNKNIHINNLTNSNTINFLCEANKTNTSYNIILSTKDTIPTLNLGNRILLKKQDNITLNSKCIISIKHFKFKIPNVSSISHLYIGNLINLTNPSEGYATIEYANAKLAEANAYTDDKIANIPGGGGSASTTENIVIAGGPLANNIIDSGDEWPWTENGVKIIPAGKSMEEILTGLFLRPENGTAEWGQVSWDYSIAKPSVALSHSGDIEVGSKIKVTTLSAGAATPGTRRVTCDTNHGYFLSTESGAEHKSGNLVLEQAGNDIKGTATLTTTWNNKAVDITTNSTELEVAADTNTLNVSQLGQTASVNLLPATTVYVSTNTNKLAKNEEGNYIAVPFTDSEDLCIKSKALSNSNSAQVTGKYYNFYKTFASGATVTAPESSAKANGYTANFTAPTNFNLNIDESKSFSKIIIYTIKTIKEVKYVTPVMGQDWTTSNTTRTSAQVIKLPNGSNQSDYNKYVIATADDSNFPVGQGCYVSVTYN